MIKYTDQRDPFTIKEIREMIEFEQEIRPPDIYPESNLAALCREWLELKNANTHLRQRNENIEQIRYRESVYERPAGRRAPDHDSMGPEK